MRRKYSKYTTYTTSELLADESFLLAEKDTTGEQQKDWDRLASENETFARELKTARKILADIREEANKNQLFRDEEMSLWDRIETTKNKYNQQKRRRNFMLTAISVAASVLVIGFTFHFLFNPSVEKEIDHSSIITRKSAAMNDMDITLILSEDKEISMSGKEAEVDYEKGYVRMRTDELGNEKKEEIKGKTNQLLVPKGKRSFVTLSDGTKMWVNAGTIVVYPVEFSGSKREIYMEGEVFLDVVPDRQKPFLVRTGNICVEVLGTRFDVSAYKDDSLHFVTLVDGKVEVSLPDKSKQSLNPNQQLIYGNKDWKVEDVKDLDHLGWIYGYYQYKDQPLSAVLKGLAKYYGYKITCDDQVHKLICSGKIDLKNDIKEVMETLQDAASITVDYNSENIHIYVKP